MRNLLLAFDGLHFSEDILEFAKQMNNIQPIRATGVFLSGIGLAEILYSFGGIMSGPMYLNEVIAIDETTLQDNIARFAKFCDANMIRYKVLTDDTDDVVAQLMGYTRFADALIINSSSFYSDGGKDFSHEYITTTLHKSECPVILIPGPYKTPKSIVLAYDGSEHSVFAIKQFTSLFPEFKHTKVLLMHFSTNEGQIPEVGNIEDYLHLYYTDVIVSQMHIDAGKYLETWLVDNGNTLMVTGAYSRPPLSEMLKKSFIDEVITDHKVPLFISHR